MTEYIVDFNNILRSVKNAPVTAQREESEEYGTSIHLTAIDPRNDEKLQSWYGVSTKKGTKFEHLVSQMRETGLLTDDEIASTVASGRYDALVDLIVERVNEQGVFNVTEEKGVGKSLNKTLVLKAVAEPFQQDDETSDDAEEDEDTEETQEE